MKFQNVRSAVAEAFKDFWASQMGLWHVKSESALDNLKSDDGCHRLETLETWRFMNI